MAHDLIIRGGSVLDGTGADAVRADVAVDGDRITAIGDLADATATREIDATGLTVTPGFVDLHTHMDAQVGWDPFMTSCSWHGVTTAMMGNCGVTFAPAVADGPGLPRRDDAERRGHPERRHPRRAAVGLGDAPAVPRLRRSGWSRRSTSSRWSGTARCGTR